MAKTGDTIENPFSGERITFIQTTTDTNGELLRFEYVLPPGFSIPEHVHPRQEERHEILSGTLRGRVGGRERDYREGERAIGPAGVPHAWRNPSDGEELLIISELRPPLGFEDLIETGFAIARDLKTDRVGTPKHLLRIVMLLDEAGGMFYPTGVPAPAWRAFRALVAALSRLGKSLGYEARSPQRLPKDRSKVAGLLAAGSLAVLAFALLRRAGDAGRASDGSGRSGASFPGGCVEARRVPSCSRSVRMPNRS